MPKFSMKFAPHFGMFGDMVSEDPIDQLKFMADQGFTAFEDNGMMGRSVQEQEAIGQALDRLGMTMGVFVALGDFGSKAMVNNDSQEREAILDRMKEAVEVAKRVHAKWCTVVPGAFDPQMNPYYQMANVIDSLRYCAEILEPAGLIMVLEPLNYRNHPGLFLTGTAQAYAICRAVNSPSCKILYDAYHQQIQEGDIITNIDQAWNEIGYIQVGDNPGRNQPGTGEMNYLNIFRHLKQKGYDGIIGMEHGVSGDGHALIAAYRACDPV